IFYPEGGGQPADRGRLGNRRVCDVQRDDVGVVHYCDGPLTPGSRVTGTIDQERRQDFCRQHSGEHIISGLAHSMYGCNNVGFHLNDDYMTLDFDQKLSDDQVAELEDRANTVVLQNLPIEIQYYDEEDAVTVDYRSKMSLIGKVRIVHIPDVDDCACCGTQCNFTGEIGLIKFIDHMTMRGGSRLTALCGERAYADYVKRFEQSREISGMLSAPADDLVPALEQREAQHEEDRQALVQLRRRINQLYLDSVPDTAGNVLFLLAESDQNSAKYMAKQLAERISGVAMIFFPHPRTSGYMYIFSSGTADAKKMSEQLKERLDLKGGGHAHMVQGVTGVDAETILRVCEPFAWTLKSTQGIQGHGGDSHEE
ncbi:MAG TPA: alanyl-tRNA editing protein, partial [Clostridiaceae bacterium]|nr:alanyl-tRNA editing protein [Clostridiaceae bacterium]